jgi:glycosyltransferase involved in cell wall biosynthesis
MENRIYDFKMIFATNDARFRHLEAELCKKVIGFTTVTYDPVSFINKYVAAALTYHPHRKIWWNRYQWHPMMQSGRRSRLVRMIEEAKMEFDVLLMLGSWFDPFAQTGVRAPFYVYIDQSCNKHADENDMQSKALDRARSKFNKTQFLTYQQCNGIFCLSDWARRQTLEAHNIAEEKVTKVGWGPVGVNLLDEPICINDREPYVLFVGHEFYRKGVDILRAAIPKVVNEVRNVRFKVVGGNSDHLHVEPHDNLDILGPVSSVDKMKDLYRNATVFVLPHRFDRSPHVLIEAMSAGKPIITSSQGGATEVVQQGKNGFVIEVGDTASLSQYIITLLKDRNMRLAFGEQSRKIMREGYTWDAVASKMLTFIAKTK